MIIAVVTITVLIAFTLLAFLFPTKKRKEKRKIRKIISKAKKHALKNENKSTETKHQVEYNGLNIVIDTVDLESDHLLQDIMIEYNEETVFKADIHYYFNNYPSPFNTEYYNPMMKIQDIFLYIPGEWEERL